MPAKSRNGDDPKSPPGFVFRGVVKKTRAATMKEVPVGSRTAIVRVEEVLEAPSALAKLKGQDIAVELSGKKKIAKGDTLILHTRSWVFGKSVAVRSEREERTETTGGARAAGLSDPAETRRIRKVRAQLDRADLVVSGKVAAVTVPPTPSRARSLTAVKTTEGLRVSEHDPKWRQAVIDVHETHKGSRTPAQVTVLFPASTDVRWYRAPKFQAGQIAVFILKKTKLKTDEHRELRGLRRGGAAGEVEVYTALDPNDVHAVGQETIIKGLVR